MKTTPLLLCVAVSLFSVAQGCSVGKEFITAFLTNHQVAVEPKMELVITSHGIPATVQIRLISPPFNTTVMLSEKETKWVTLPEAAELKTPGLSHSVVHVSSSADISLVTFNSRHHTTESSRVLPSHQLGVEYWAFTPIFGTEAKQLAVVNGPVANTVTFRSPTSVHIDGIGTWNAGQNVNVKLEPYQSYLLHSTFSLTGMQVKSQFPVAVLAGHVCSVLKTACNHVYEQLLPLHLLSTSYLVPAMHPAGSSLDLAHIVATEDGTVVTVTLGNSTTSQKLKAGQTFARDVTFESPLLIQSNKKVMVMYYSNNAPFDPFLTSILPSSQSASDWSVDTLGNFLSTAVVLSLREGVHSVRIYSKETKDVQIKWNTFLPDDKYMWSIVILGKEQGNFIIEGDSIVSVYVYGGSSHDGYGTFGVCSSAAVPSPPTPDPCDKNKCKDKEELPTLGTAGPELAQGCSVGKEFITAFLTNHQVAVEPKMELVITSHGIPATVQIRLISPPFNTTVMLSEKETKWVTLPEAAELKTPGLSHSVVHVSSSADISLVTFNSRHHTTESSRVLPSHQLGVEYWAFTPIFGTEAKQLAVVNGPVANTVTFRSPTSVHIDGIGTWNAGQNVNVKLEPYQSYLLHSTFSLTGMQVKSQFPVAVLAGHVCSVLKTACNHVYEQLLPLHLLSTSYLVPAMHPAGSSLDLAHIVATEDGTVVTVTLGNSTTSQKLKAGQTFARDVTFESPLLIQSNKKVMVMYYSNNAPFDPFLTSILPSSQSASDWSVDTLGNFLSTAVVLSLREGVHSVRIYSKETKDVQIKWNTFLPDDKYMWSIVILGKEQGNFIIEGDSIVSVYVYGGSSHDGYGTFGVCSSAAVPSPPTPDPCDKNKCKDKEELPTLGTAGPELAQGCSVGKEFITAFLTNHQVAVEPKMELVITSHGIPATVQIRLISPPFNTTVMLSEKETKWVTLPEAAELKTPGLSHSVVHVSSSADISLVTFNSRHHTTESSRVLPSHQLGVEYWAFTPIFGTEAKQLAVVNGPVANTVTFRSPTSVHIDGIGTWNAGQNVNVKLEPYQSYLLHSTFSLTGMQVKSQFPVAVLAGHVCSVLKTACNHVYEQLLPLHLLSTSYLVPAMHPAGSSLDLAHIVATEDGTVVTVTLGNSTTSQKLKAGQTFARDVTFESPLLIQSNKKVMVMYYSNNAPFDPFLTSILPSSQSASDWSVDTLGNFLSTAVVLSLREGVHSVRIYSKETKDVQIKWNTFLPDDKYMWSIVILGKEQGNFIIEGDSIVSVYVYGGSSHDGYGTFGVCSSAAVPSPPTPDPCDKNKCKDKEELPTLGTAGPELAQGCSVGKEFITAFLTNHQVAVEPKMELVITSHGIPATVQIRLISPPFNTTVMLSEKETKWVTLPEAAELKTPGLSHSVVHVSSSADISLVTFNSRHHTTESSRVLPSHQLGVEYWAFTPIFGTEAKQLAVVNGPVANTVTFRSPTSVHIDGIGTWNAGQNVNVKLEPYQSYLLHSTFSLTGMQVKSQFPVAVLAGHVCSVLKTACNHVYEQLLPLHLLSTSYLVPAMHPAGSSLDLAHIVATEDGTVVTVTLGNSTTSQKLKAGQTFARDVTFESPLLIQSNKKVMVMYYSNNAPFDPFLTSILPSSQSASDWSVDTLGNFLSTAVVLSLREGVHSVRIYSKETKDVQIKWNTFLPDDKYMWSIVILGKEQGNFIIEGDSIVSVYVYGGSSHDGYGTFGVCSSAAVPSPPTPDPCDKNKCKDKEELPTLGTAGPELAQGCSVGKEFITAFLTNHQVAVEPKMELVITSHGIPATVQIRLISPPFNTTVMLSEKETKWVTLPEAAELKTPGLSHSVVHVSSSADISLVTFNSRHHTTESSRVLPSHQLGVEYWAFTPIFGTEAKQLAVVNGPVANTVTFRSPTSVHIDGIGTWNAGQNVNVKLEPYQSYLLHSTFSLTGMQVKSQFPVAVLAGHVCSVLKTACNHVYEQLLPLHLLSTSYLVPAMHPAGSSLDLAHIVATEDGTVVTVTLGNSTTSQKLKAGQTFARDVTFESPLLIQSNKKVMVMYYSNNAPFDPFLTSILPSSQSASDWSVDTLGNFLSTAVVLSLREGVHSVRIYSKETKDVQIKWNTFLPDDKYMWSIVILGKEQGNFIIEGDSIVSVYVYGGSSHDGYGTFGVCSSAAVPSPPTPDPCDKNKCKDKEELPTLGTAGPELAQGCSVGKEFITAFLTNHQVAVEPKMELVITSHGIPATVQIRLISPPFNTTVMLSEKETKWVTLPEAAELKTPGLSHSVVHVSSSADISLVTFNSRHHTTESSRVLPSHQLGVEYWAFTPIFGTEAKQLAVVNGPVANTVTFRSPTSVHIDGIGTWNAGQNVNVKLEPYQSYLLHSTFSLTGMQVKSQFPVAVLAGHVCSVLKTACNHVYEQLLPLHLLSTSYLVPAMHPAGSSLDLAHIVATEDGTVVTVTLGNSTTSQKLKAGQTFARDVTFESPLLIQSNKKVMVMYYSNNAPFDPFLTSILPSSQSASDWSVDTLGNFLSTAVVLSLREGVHSVRIYSKETKDVQIKWNTFLPDDKYMWSIVILGKEQGNFIIEGDSIVSVYVYGGSSHDGYGTFGVCSSAAVPSPPTPDPCDKNKCKDKEELPTLGTAGPELAQGCSVGKEFITAFLTNHQVAVEPKMELVITSHGIPATVQIRLISPPFNTTVMLSEKETKWVTLPEAAELKTPGLSHSVVHVSSSADISLVTFNSRHHTTESSRVLPSHQLGVEYWAFTPIFGTEAKQLAVVNGPVANTVTFRSPTSVHIDGIGTWNAGQNVNVKLEPYQSYLLHSTFSLTGMQVKSQFPVAVLAGHVCSVLKTACNHVYEQLLPLHLLSTSYLVPAMHPAGSSLDLAHIVATEDGTVVTVTLGNSTTSQKLKAGQTFARDVTFESPLLIQSNKKVMVMYYSNNAPFDPFLTSILPSSQSASDWSVDTLGNFLSTAVVLSLREGVHSVRIYSKETKDVQIKWNTFLPDDKYMWSIVILGKEQGNFIIEGDSIVSVYVYGGSSHDGYGTFGVCSSAAVPSPPTPDPCDKNKCKDKEELPTLGTAGPELAQGCSVGKEFITAFLTNHQVAVEPKMELVITSHGIPATVQIRLISPPFNTTVMLSEKETKWVTLPEAAELKTPGLSHSVVHVSSSADISLVTFNSRHHTTESSRVLPSHQLGVEYWAFTPIFGTEAKQLAVVNGPVANTVTFRSPTSVHIDGIGTWNAGQNVNVKLEPYQSYLLHSTFSLTGMQVKSQFPVAVLAGHVCSVLKTACNHVYEQLLPLHLLSTSYLVPAMHPAGSSLDLAHIVATEDGTVVTVTLGNSTTSQKLKAGQTFARDVTFESPLLIQSNKKVMVMYYSNNAPFDPFLTSILPSSQSASDWSVDTLGNFLSTAVVLSLREGVHSVRIYSKETKDVQIKWNTFLPDDKYMWSIVILGKEQGNFIIEGDSIVSVYVYGGSSHDGYGTFGVCSSAAVPSPPTPDPCDKIKCKEKEECKNGECVHISETTCHAVGHPHFTCRANEECVTRDGVLACFAKKSSTCHVGGAREYTSFDGRAFSVYGDCTYKLVEVEQSGEMTPFTVLVLQQTAKGGVTRRVEIHTPIYNITMIPGLAWQVVINGIRVHLPVSLGKGQVLASQSGVNIVVETDFGLKVTYDSVGGVIVHLPSTYKGITLGLCGNYNNQLNDDFRLPNNTQALSKETFTNGWVISEEDVTCQTGCDGSACPEPDRQKKPEAEKACDIIRASQGPFANCHSIVPPSSYYEACVKELTLPGGGQEVLCQHIQMYVSLCQAAGATVNSWRSNSFCPLKCPARTHYELCSDTCSSTCASLSAPAQCPPCQEGCQCDEGLVFDGGECVAVDTCGCVVEGKYYKSGQSVMMEDCFEVCSCKTGQFTCQTHQCGMGMECRVEGFGVLGCYAKDPCVEIKCREKESCMVENDVVVCVALSKAVCWAMGDPHYSTFDGTLFSFQGTSSYTLVNTTRQDPTLTDFTILTKNARLRNSLFSSMRSTTLYLLGHKISILAGQRGSVEVDGVRTSLPVILESGNIKIAQSGKIGTIQSSVGLEVGFDWNTLVRVTVSSSYYGNLQGICGNYNGNRKDDFTMPSGVLTSNITEWGESWSVGDKYKR